MDYKSQIATYYSEKALTYGIHPHRLRATIDLFPNKEHLRILDIGCATGYLGAVFCQQGHFVVGIDISDKAIKHANKFLSSVYVLNIETDKLPKMGTFDLILLSEVIEHFFQPQETLKKICPLLKENGSLIISTPNFLYWGNRLQFLRGKFSYTGQGTFDESHIHFYTYSSLKLLLDNLGLSVIKENHLTAGGLSQVLVKWFPGFFACHLLISARRK